MFVVAQILPQLQHLNNPCDCGTEHGKRRCVTGQPNVYEQCTYKFTDACTWMKSFCLSGTTCKDGLCI